MNKFLLSGAVALGAFAVIPAMAQMAPPPPPTPGTPMMMTMHKMPTTRAEVAGHVAEMFAMHDTNKDGTVTKAEMAASMPMMGRWQGKAGMGDPNAAFDRLDANKDGMISRDEFKAGREMRIERRIEMRDGKVVKDEEMRDGKKVEHHGDMKGDHHVMMKGEHAMMGHHKGMKMRMGGGMGLFGRADTNKDGNVTLAEAQAAAYAHFDKRDANKDGTLQDSERPKAKMKMMMIERRN